MTAVGHGMIFLNSILSSKSEQTIYITSTIYPLIRLVGRSTSVEIYDTVHSIEGTPTIFV